MFEIFEKYFKVDMCKTDKYLQFRDDSEFADITSDFLKNH